jgi:C4-dicarboxylate-binding protein DctP
MIQEINQKANGRLEIKPFFSEQVAKANDMLDALSTGSVESAWEPTTYFAGTVPIWNLPLLPFLFDNYDQLVKGWNAGIKQIWIDQAATKLNAHIMGSTFYYTGLVCIFSNKSLPKLPADIKGLKIRSFNPLLDTLMQSAAAAPTSMASPEVYLAMQRGTVDGYMTSPVGMVSYKLFEVTKFGNYMNITPGSMDLPMVNMKAWQALPDDLKQIVDETAMKHLTAWGKEKEPGIDKDAFATMTKGGTQMYTPTTQDLDAWRAISKPAWDKFIQTAGPIGQQQIDIMQKAR